MSSDSVITESSDRNCGVACISRKEVGHGGSIFFLSGCSNTNFQLGSMNSRPSPLARSNGQVIINPINSRSIVVVDLFLTCVSCGTLAHVRLSRMKHTSSFEPLVWIGNILYTRYKFPCPNAHVGVEVDTVVVASLTNLFPLIII